VTAVFVAQVTPMAAMVAYDAAHEVKGLVRGDPLIHRHWEIARGLQALGLQPGDRVAVAGDFFTAGGAAPAAWAGAFFTAGWARRARLRVTAAVEPVAATASVAGAGVLDAALARAGVRAVVAEGGPLDDAGWTRLGDGHTWARLIPGVAPRTPQARVRRCALQSTGGRCVAARGPGY